MAKCKNLVILIGHVGKDPDVSYTQSGTARAKFSLATGEKWKDNSGEWQERTEWHNIVAWGKTAEYVGEYIRKGNFLYVEGKIQTREWEKDDGTKVYFTEIVGRDLITLRSKEGSPADSGSGYGGSGGYKKPQQSSLIPPTEDDDIPF